MRAFDTTQSHNQCDHSHEEGNSKYEEVFKLKHTKKPPKELELFIEANTPQTQKQNFKVLCAALHPLQPYARKPCCGNNLNVH